MENQNVYAELAAFGKELLSHKQLDGGLPVIADYLKRLTGAMRCSIFIYDKETMELWTILANGVERIVVPVNKGIVGHIFMEKKAIIENNVAHNPYFLKEVDKDSGYETVNMLGCPIYNAASQQVIGVLQLINKTSGFNDRDMQFINVIIRFIGSFIELSCAYRESEH
ncbi:GAF domain-containing protein [Sulfurovum sp.]|uniref:GAF domain-containing protein n=1 Tax=Sulfurovum sp. TaxID=1969726 RepID=UPI0025F39EC3|nr:GAF domain-containing protein [Sulfurovum sp.]